MKISPLQKGCDTPEKLDMYVKARIENAKRESIAETILSPIKYISSIWSPMGHVGIEILFKDGRTEKSKCSILEYIDSEINKRLT